MLDDVGQPLPDTSEWKPEHSKNDTLDRAFFLRCQHVEAMALARVAQEKKFNQHNFDSGPGTEDVIRDGIRQILPNRYAVGAGVISDSEGYSAGDCDVVIYNDQWFPAIKDGATSASRRRMFAIESVYAVLEVKQRLTIRSLDDAMKKLVTCHRLLRPESPRDRVVENVALGACDHFISNPLYSAIIAAGVNSMEDFESLAYRFVQINQTLPRRNMVRALCVLDYGTVMWAAPDDPFSPFAPGSSKLKPATFMYSDRYAELVPVRSSRQVGDDSEALYELVCNLMSHLFHSVLMPDDVAVHYGYADGKIRAPTDRAPVVPQDAELMDHIRRPCKMAHDYDDVYHGRRVRD